MRQPSDLPPTSTGRSAAAFAASNAASHVSRSTRSVSGERRPRSTYGKLKRIVATASSAIAPQKPARNGCSIPDPAPWATTSDATAPAGSIQIVPTVPVATSSRPRTSGVATPELVGARGLRRMPASRGCAVDHHSDELRYSCDHQVERCSRLDVLGDSQIHLITCEQNSLNPTAASTGMRATTNDRSTSRARRSLRWPQPARSSTRLLPAWLGARERGLRGRWKRPCASDGCRHASDRDVLSRAERLREVHERVVDLEWPAADGDHPGDAHRIDPCIGVAELRIEIPRRDIPVLTDAQADGLPAPRPRFLLSCIRKLSSDPLASPLGHHEDILNLGNAQVCADPSDVRVPDRPIIVPGDEVGRAFCDLLV